MAPSADDGRIYRRRQFLAELALAAEGVLRVVWDGRFGTMLIEVVDGQVFVNGQQVLPVGPRCS
jgi:hypothetical protein